MAVTGRPRRRRPPLRRCELCGGNYYGWHEHGVCRSCQPELSTGVADVVREQRAERLAGRDAGLEHELEPGAPLKYGELPPGF